MMFKIGDRVRRIGYGFAYAPLGYEAIVEVDDCGDIGVLDLESEFINLRPSCWEIIEDRAMFKVGDRVKDYEDDTAEVLEVCADGRVRLRYDESSYDQGEWTYSPDELKLVLTPASPIRTVTSREIVDGQYGAVNVHSVDISVYVRTDSDTAAEQLRNAAATLLEIADAL